MREFIICQCCSQFIINEYDHVKEWAQPCYADTLPIIISYGCTNLKKVEFK